jgi:hypothetical protein
MEFTRAAYEAGRARWEALRLVARTAQDARELPEWDEVPPFPQEGS